MIVTLSGWLDPVIKDESPRSSQLAVPRPICIVHHATATDASAQALARKIRTYRPHSKTCPPDCREHDRAASWHVIVSRTGEIWQSVPFTRAAWHCPSPVTVGGKKYASANRISASIEWQAPAQVKGKWAEFTDAQRAVWPELRGALRAYAGGPIPDIGHYELDPARRSDPGKAWLDWLRAAP